MFFLLYQEKRRLAINNAKRQWEVMQGSLIQKSTKLTHVPELYANHIGSIPNSEVVSPDIEESKEELESITRSVLFYQYVFVLFFIGRIIFKYLFSNLLPHKYELASITRSVQVIKTKLFCLFFYPLFDIMHFCTENSDILDWL